MSPCSNTLTNHKRKMIDKRGGSFGYREVQIDESAVWANRLEWGLASEASSTLHSPRPVHWPWLRILLGME